jgi:hypothetical protein
MSPKLLRSQLLLVLGVVMFATTAPAKPQFPGVISSQLQLTYEPPCSVCHTANKTGGATITTLFGYALRERGLTDGRSLPSALGRLDADKADSDGDGVADVSELRNGTDPNSKANASLVHVADPSFGCSAARPRRSSPIGLVALLAAAAVTLVFTRRAS